MVVDSTWMIQYVMVMETLFIIIKNVFNWYDFFGVETVWSENSLCLEWSFQLIKINSIVFIFTFCQGSSAETRLSYTLHEEWLVQGWTYWPQRWTPVYWTKVWLGQIYELKPYHKYHWYEGVCVRACTCAWLRDNDYTERREIERENL